MKKTMNSAFGILLCLALVLGLMPGMIIEAGAVGTVLTLPAAKDLTYTGDYQELITGGTTAAGYHFEYALGSGSGNMNWQTGIPKGKEPGTHNVWYKVVNNNDNSESTPVEIVVKIKIPLTITARDQEYIYDGSPHGEPDPVYDDPAQIAEKVIVEGLQGTDKVKSIVITGTATEIGVYKDRLQVTGADVDSNEYYSIIYVPGTLTIKKGPNDYNVDSIQGGEHVLGENKDVVYTVTNSVDDNRPYEWFSDGSVETTLKILAAEPTATPTAAPTPTPTPTPAPTAAPTPTPTPKPVPKTGDGANPALWLGLILLGLLSVGGTLVLSRRRRG